MALLPLSQRDIRQQSWLINGSSLLKKHTDWFDSETFRSLLLQALSLSLTHFEHFEVCSLCTCGCGMKQNAEVTFVYKSHCHMLDESTKRHVEVPPNIWNQVITAHPHVSGEQRLINSYCVYTLAVKLCICSIIFVL